MKAIKRLIFLLILAAAALVAYAYSGLYSVAVGTGHNPVTRWYLSTLRERSVEVRAEQLQVPADLDSEQRIRAGAGHYSQMCVGCHGHPGREPSDHFEPAPPALSRRADEADEAFWIVKNGIKMSAMPQHRDHSDEDIWDIVAFLQRLPHLSVSDYEAITAATEHRHDEGGQVEDSPALALPADAVTAVDAFHQALLDGNGHAALTLLHDKGTIVENGQVETKQEYAGHHLGADMEFAAATHSEQLSRTQQVNAGQATVRTRSHISGSYDGAAVDLVTDEVVSLIQTGNGWLITHIQWSPAAIEGKPALAPSGKPGGG